MSALVIPHPDGITWERWSETVVGFNPQFTNQLWAGMRWQEFARRLSLIEPAAPRPEFFKDWRPWAAALRQALEA